MGPPDNWIHNIPHYFEDELMDAPDPSECQFEDESWDIHNEHDPAPEPHEALPDWQVNGEVPPVSADDPEPPYPVEYPEDADVEGSTEDKEQSHEPGEAEGNPGWDHGTDSFALPVISLFHIWAVHFKAE